MNPFNRSIIYVDGFNLYYGAVKGTAWKWLDLQRYFTLLRMDDDIQVIKYFTAMINGSHLHNQEAYLNALAANCPKLNIILGQYKLKNVLCGVRTCNYRGPRVFSMPEEKRTDVNIAVQMVFDAVSDACDRFVLVSGDCDLVPAVRMVKEIAPQKTITVYVPATNAVRGAAVELRSAADKHRTLPLNLFPKTQFPPQVPDGSGGWISKPQTW